MKRNTRGVPAVCSLLVLVATAVYLGATPSTRSSMQSATTAGQTGASNAEQEVRAAHQQLVEAGRTADKEAARRLMADELTWVNGEGKVMTRDSMLAGNPNPPREVTVDRVLTFANAALVTGSAQLQSGLRVRFLQEWVNRDGQWRLLAHQGTRLSLGSGAAQPTTPPPSGTAGTSGTSGTSVTSTLTPSSPTLNSDEERAVWKVQTDLTRAFLSGDTTTYSTLTSDDFIRIAASGEQQGKSQFLQDVKMNANQSAGKIEVGDAQVFVAGETARVVFTSWGTLPGGQRLDPARVTRVFLRRGGQWQQAAAIFTPLSPQ